MLVRWAVCWIFGFDLRGFALLNASGLRRRRSRDRGCRVRGEGELLPPRGGYRLWRIGGLFVADLEDWSPFPQFQSAFDQIGDDHPACDLGSQHGRGAQEFL